MGIIFWFFMVDLRGLWGNELIFERFLKESNFLLIYFITISFVGVGTLSFGADSCTILAYDCLFSLCCCCGGVGLIGGSFCKEL